ncbi:unnamed protein product [Sympodiomycopsis kandeliae]
MARKTFCIPSLITTFAALILLLLVTISIPLTFHSSSPFYIVSGSDLNGTIVDKTDNGANPNRNLTDIRGGLWGYCTKGQGESSFGFCSPNDHEYQISLARSEANSGAAYEQTEIKKSWTRGLVVAVVAFVATVIGFILSFFPQLGIQLIACLVLLLSLLLTLIAFAIQIAYFVYFKNRIHRLSDSASVTPGPGFYLTLISLPLLLFSAVTVLCGWKKEKSGEPAGYDTGYGSSKKSKFGGFGMSRPWKRNNKDASAAQNGSSDQPYSVGTYGQKSNDAGYNASTVNTAHTENQDSIPLTSRQRVLDAYNSSS